MSCYHPKPAYKLRVGGEVRMGYCKPGGNSDRLELPCGVCIGCKLDRARGWSIRITHEAQMFDCNWFVTLTYDEKSLPKSLSLEYRDFQGFLKRLRARLRGVTLGPDGGYPIRFFCSGEYGGKTCRPHWHAILFNVDFADKVPFVNGTYSSAVVEDLWKRGNVVLGSVTPESAAYVAGYTLKKVHGVEAREHYEDVLDLSTGEITSRRPEFVVMSRRPGIGAWWFRRFSADVLPVDHAVMAGTKYKVPRFYLERFKRTADAGQVEDVMYDRFLRAMVMRAESTPERRAVHEEIAVARQALFADRGL